MVAIDGCVAQSLPEHPKREHIFSMSSAYGEAYLFQVDSLICDRLLFTVLLRTADTIYDRINESDGVTFE